MQNLSATLILLLLPIITCANNIPETKPKKYTLEAIYKDNLFNLNYIDNLNWLEDGSAFLFSKPNDALTKKYNKEYIDIYRHDIESGKETLLISSEQIKYKNKPLDFVKFTNIPNSNRLLLTSNKEKIWRRSYYASYFLYNPDTKKLTAIAEGAKDLLNVSPSPDGTHLAYAQNNNLFLVNLSDFSTTQLSKDGSDNILNAVFDWVYEEEFGRTDAYHWSPDSRHIAFWRTDQTRVKTFYMLDELPTYNKLIPIKYPKTGEQNAIVKIGVINIANKQVQWMDIGDNDDIYIPRMYWTKQSDNLIIERLNRKQNKLEFLLANPQSGKSGIIAKDKSKAWIDIDDDTYFFQQQTAFVWTSEKSGFNHIYLSNYKNKKTYALTEGNWEVYSVIGVDEKNGWVYFAGKRDSVLEKHLYRTSVKTKTIEKISQDLGSYSAKFNPTYTHYIQNASAHDTPTQVSLNQADGSLVRMLKKNDLDVFKQYPQYRREFIKLKTQDGVTLNAEITKPKDFDRNKKYPVIIYAYAGPGSQRVLNAWPSRNGPLNNYLAQEGYLLFTVDNRGTGGRGTDFKHVAYRDFSKWAVHDQIEGVKYLRTLPYVDASNIGFWGASFGGYMAGMLITRASDYVSTAVSMAMVSDYYNYDTIWTERYMDHPKNNKAGYKAANVLEYTDLLKGNILLIHGSGDDNVHLQNTIEWVDRLIEKNKQFDLMIYPNRSHSINGGNTELHLYTLMYNYFNRHLK